MWQPHFWISEYAICRRHNFTSTSQIFSDIFNNLSDLSLMFLYDSPWHKRFGIEDVSLVRVLASSQLFSLMQIRCRGPFKKTRSSGEYSLCTWNYTILVTDRDLSVIYDQFWLSTCVFVRKITTKKIVCQKIQFGLLTYFWHVNSL